MIKIRVDEILNERDPAKQLTLSRELRTDILSGMSALQRPKSTQKNMFPPSCYPSLVDTE